MFYRYRICLAGRKMNIVCESREELIQQSAEGQGLSQGRAGQEMLQQRVGALELGSVGMAVAWIQMLKS